MFTLGPNMRTLFILFCTLATVYGQLVINVKNKGGDIVQVHISTNTTDNTVILEFQRSDGTLITQIIDFTNNVQILRALVLGEEERGQSQYQVMCFVTHFKTDEFIPSDAMSKLRQKNPGTVRTAEDDLGRQVYEMDYFINLPSSGVISRHINTVCSEAGNFTYTRKQDLLLWANKPGASELSLKSAVRQFANYDKKVPLDNSVKAAVSKANLPSCKDTVSYFKVPCECHFDVCIGWYPCGLKFCGPKNGNKNQQSAVKYRCGIKTCQRTYSFSYYVSQKHYCLWDE